MGKWQLISKNQKGQLDRAGRYLEGVEDLAAFEVITPITQDKKIAMAHAPDLAVNAARSLEITWDKKSGKLVIIAVTGRDDVPNFQSSLRLCYPNCGFGQVQDEVTPGWFDVRDKYQIFDVSTTHGHSFAMMDSTKEPTLMAKACAAVQHAENAWIQFVFERQEFALDNLSNKVQKFEDFINRPVVYYGESGGKKKRYTRNHEEKTGDFNSSVKGIRRHLTERMGGGQIMISVRGIIKAQKEIDMEGVFSAVDAMPLEGLTSSFERLGACKYDISTFYDKEKPKKTWVKVGGRMQKISRLEALFERRLLPDPKKFLDKFCSEYCGTKWWSFFGSRAYHDRRPLPFVMAGRDAGAILHLPDPNDVSNIHSTRGRNMPRSYHEKTGFSFGKYV